MPEHYDAILVVSFGGPEGPADVMPFLENVLRGKNVPRARMLEVAEHYRHFGGKSPLNDQNRALVAALAKLLAAEGPQLPVYLGNRNWHPLLADTLGQMARDGVTRALGLFTSAYSSYSSCRQYLEDIERAREAVGPRAPTVDKLRAFYNHPGFIASTADCTRVAWETIPAERRASALGLFTAHSIPVAMADACPYVAQLEEAMRLVAVEVGLPAARLVYQSRSGPPQQPWLEPDILDVLRKIAAAGTARDVVVVPIGFLSEHVEILWDLDTEARALCDQLGLNMVRAGTVSSHAGFIAMIRELILERTAAAPKRALGTMGPSHDVCATDCCIWTRAGATPAR